MFISIFSILFLLTSITFIEFRFLYSNNSHAFADIDNSHNQVHNHQQIEDIKIFKNALEFSSVKLRECVVPRTELVTIQLHDTIENVTQKFITSGYSKILVYEDSIDNIIGYIHNSEIFKKPQKISDILRPIEFVPETMNAKKLLLQLIHSKQSIAVVVDEFGGTSGIVTIEDIIEEIFGEIKDEYDTVSLEEKRISNDEFIFSARHEIDYINEKYFLQIPVSDDYETLAGFFLFYNQKFPHINSLITIGNIKITILKITGTRIELLHIKKV
jgi:CBS domain containing-hemolysin-like protein